MCIWTNQEYNALINSRQCRNVQIPAKITYLFEYTELMNNRQYKCKEYLGLHIVYLSAELTVWCLWSKVFYLFYNYYKNTKVQIKKVQIITVQIT